MTKLSGRLCVCVFGNIPGVLIVQLRTAIVFIVHHASDIRHNVVCVCVKESVTCWGCRGTGKG